ncbi:bone morphogenetic protein 4-like [Patiria miniata]|uniref:TGF-beta family profile domain-containing protein n=1 Tax=Patiria miniata TaxID=46514 RepID=A0A914AD10_PATMI|nr:bone morphogenetic protein 4-like [Patiria miniata]
MLLSRQSCILLVLTVCCLMVMLPHASSRAVARVDENLSGTHPSSSRGRDHPSPASNLGEGTVHHQSQSGVDEESNVIMTQQKEQVLGELFRAIGLENNTLEEPARRPQPPPFMLDLYSSIADPSSGKMKMPRPFNANTVRSLPDKADKHRLHFQFNLSHVPATEMLLQAELHLFRLKPKMRPTVTVSGKRQPFYQIQLYQLASEDLTSIEGAKLIGLRLVRSVGTEWEVFSITDAVSSWLADERTNFGVLVTISSLTGEPMDENFIRFAQQGKHHPTKHPFLVLYTSDLRQMDSAHTGQDAVESAYETFFETYGNLNSPPFTDSTQAGPTPNVNTNRYSDDKVTTTKETRTGTATSRNRRDNRQDLDTESPTEDSATAGGSSGKKASPKGTCARKSMYVDFHEIGWSDWIIYPVGYNAYECAGRCPFPLGQAVRPSNHATVQSLMHLISADVAAPCCVPSQLDPIVVLFFDSDSNVVLKQFDNMVATACGCR